MKTFPRPLVILRGHAQAHWTAWCRRGSRDFGDPHLLGGAPPCHLQVLSLLSLSCLWQAPRPSCTRGYEDQQHVASAAAQPLPCAGAGPSLHDNVHGASRELGDSGWGLKKPGAPTHQFAVTCHRNHAGPKVGSRLLFGVLRWVLGEGPGAAGTSSTGSSQGGPGPQRSAGPFSLSGCLPDRRHGLPGFLSLAWFQMTVNMPTAPPC